MPVVNSWQYVSDWIAMTGLDILKNNLNIAKKFNTDWSSEFERDFPVGSTVRVPLPVRLRSTNSFTYVPQAIEQRSTEIVVDQQMSVAFEYDSLEEALTMPRGKERLERTLIKPAMEQLAQDIESAAANFATLNTPNIVGTLGTNSATYDAIFGASRQRLTELGAPSEGRSMHLHPAVTRALGNASVSYFNPPDQMSKLFKKGIVGEAQGFETFESMSLYETTASVWQTPASVVVYGSGQTGSSLVITCTAGDTFEKGDSISITGRYAVNPATRRKANSATPRQFVITQDLTAAGGAGADTLQIYPPISGPGSPYQNIDALPVNGDILVLYPGTTTPSTGPVSGINSLALTPDAFLMVGVKLMMPTKAEMASQKRDPETGLQIAFIRDFDPIQRKMINRFDCLLGFGRGYADSGAVRVLGA